MPIQLQEVLKTDTLEIQRQKFNQVALDIFNTLAGGTDLNVGTVGLADGTLAEPALYFNSDPSLGIYRPGEFQFDIVADNNTVARFGYPNYNPQGANVAKALFFKDINVVTNSGVTSFNITNPGRGYSTRLDKNEYVSLYKNVSLNTTSGLGSGLVADIEISAFDGTITNPGSNYNPGNYSSVELINVSRTSTTATGQIQVAGINYTPGSYTNVPVTGGNGTGMLLNITASSGIPNGVITSVSIANPGSGYFPNDTVSIGTLGGTGSGFQYKILTYDETASGTIVDLTISGIGGSITTAGSGYVSGIYSNVPLTGGSGSGATANISVPDSGNGTGPISVVTIVNSGINYAEGDVLSVNNSNLGGSGSSFQYTINSYGRVSAVNLISPGINYKVGDTLSADPVILGSTNTQITSNGSGYVPGTYPDVPLTGGTGTGFLADITVTGTTNTSGSITTAGSGYTNPATYAGVTLVNEPIDTFVVTVVPNPSPGPFLPANVYRLDGNVQQSLTLDVGNTYRFDLSDSSVSGHPLVIQTVLSGGTLPSGVSYVSKGTPGTAGAFVDLIINSSVPFAQTFVYDCSVHDGMGAAITTNNSGPVNECGTGIVADVTVSGGSITNVSITSSGSGYKVGDVLQVYRGDVGGSGSGFTYTISGFTYNSSVSSVVVTNVGSDYSNGDVLSVNNSNLGGVGSGFQYTIVSYFSGSGFLYTVDAFGSVTNFTLKSAGSGYSTSSVATLNASDVNTVQSLVKENFSLSVTSVGNVTTGVNKLSGEAVYKKLGIGVSEADLPLLNNNPDGPEVIDLLVDGISTFRDTIELKNGSANSLSLRFEDKPSTGIFSDGTSSNFSFRTDGGVNIKFDEQSTKVFKDFEFSIRQIGNRTIIGGSGYTQGNYSGIQFAGGNGTGLVGNLLIAFSFNLTSGGSGYSPISGVQEYTGVDLEGGSGQGAQATITVRDGVVEGVVLTSGGDNQYTQYDTLQITAANIALQGGDATGSGAYITITQIGAVSSVNFTDFGSGYEVNDILTFTQSTENNLGGSGFTLKIDSVLDIEQGLYDISEGIFESSGFKSGIKGIEVSSKLKIVDDRIERISTGSLKLRPFGTGNTQGIVEVDGTSAFKVPAGSQSNRPVSPVAGSIRFNTTSQSYEAYDGANWGSLGGTRDVDGNTYILPESSPGANENILFFYNNGINSLDVEQTKIKLYTATSVESRIGGSNVSEWSSGESVVSAVLPEVNYIYWNDNLYSVDTTGVLGSTSPVHTTGTETNGTVSLTWVSTVYNSFNLTASNVNVDVDNKLTINGILLFDSNGTDSNISKYSTNLNIGDGDLTADPEGTLLRLTNAGAIQINTAYGSSQTYVNVLDASLRTFQLRDLHTVTGKSTLIKGTTNAGNVTLYDPATVSGAKVTVFADNTTTGEKEVIELSIIDNGTNIYTTEVGDIYTSSKIIDVEVEYDVSNNVRLLFTLDISVATGNTVIVTTITQRIKK